ncbi:protocadherin-19 [Plakobranchus ocellatus]|uniref:Protocadherin-19 n=1 Tax=Plakobranchus ocellatus TaxID=259542 RepID=A0AAV3ZK64_9GAST|nr:protocadherin-19 [Plakobranchus ocellatus]
MISFLAFWFRLGLRQSEESFLLFRVSPDSGYVITARELTPFQNRTFNLIVEAVDGGPKPKAAQAVVVVHVLDSVNNAPIIRMTLPAISNISRVNERANPGFVVAHFIVDDSDTGMNGDVRCFIENTDARKALAADTFSLQRLRESEFKVTVYSPLDREKISSYDVTITCHDSGNPPLSASVTFSVIIEDDNDNAPQFSRPMRRVSVAENSPNDFVLRLEATDKDLNANKLIKYSLGNVTSLVSTYISVSPDTGVVTTKQPLNRELFSQLDFEVVATDSGYPPLSSTSRVVIDVLDQNDNYPRVPLGYTLSVPENRPPWTVVGQIEAIDPDLGLAGEVIYQLMSGKGGQ